MILEKVSRLEQWRNGVPWGPMTLELNLTNRCNLACQSCWQRAFEFDTTDVISTTRALALVGEAAEIGVKEVRIPGAGEPLLRKDLLDIMAEVKRHGMHGLLITNGTLWTDEGIRRTVEMDWDIVTFSVDGPRAEVNDALRGKQGAFTRVTHALRMFQAVKNEIGHALPMIRFTMVLSNRNYRLLPEMVELAERYDCEDLQVQPMTVWGASGKTLELSAEQRDELPEYAEGALTLAREYGITTNITSLLESTIVEKASDRMDEMIVEQTSSAGGLFLGLPCFEPFYNLVVLPDGTASFCSIAGGRDGESVVTRSLRDVWHGRAYQSIRKSLLDKELKDYCVRCCSAVNFESERLRDALLTRGGDAR